MNGRLTGRVRRRKWLTKDGVEHHSWEYVINFSPKPKTRSGFATKQQS